MSTFCTSFVPVPDPVYPQRVRQTETQILQESPSYQCPETPLYADILCNGHKRHLFLYQG